MDNHNQERPKIKIKKTSLETSLDIISSLLLVGNILYILLVWNTLPDTIPVHFNGAGEADGWGSKAMVWLLPAIGSLLWVGLTVLEQYPHVYNYISLTEENAERQYKNGRITINVMKAEMVVFFVYFNWKSIQIAFGSQIGLGVWELPTFLLVVFGTLAFFIIRSFRIR